MNHDPQLRQEGGRKQPQAACWLASFSGPQLYCLDPRTGEGTAHTIPRLEGQSVTALFVDQTDRLWVASELSNERPASADRAYGLFVWEHCREIEAGAMPSPAPLFTLDTKGGKVAAIIEDAAGRLWMARHGGGLLRLDPRVAGVDSRSKPSGGSGDVFRRVSTD